MKKTREIEEYFCDYCGKKCSHTDFVVPEEKKIECYIAGIKNVTSEMCETHKDICPKCQKKIVNLLKLVPNVEFKNNATCEIKFGE